ncbi:uncharacterized protein H6S33_012257 [Morchella sextelata]|uniref:uncharacterized protein n=1 Tax=Morchella sextelata TaxID=1174677 RepID=UPI001D04C0C9|nr:uncharacterized protein H6S33_012257 [Morchella sextelata]KAH0609711.1 hypothetical protein H6S33_012257 [Morchella sextelata]
MSTPHRQRQQCQRTSGQQQQQDPPQGPAQEPPPPPPPKHTYEQLTTHCNLYFTRPSEEWSYTSFATHLAAALGALKFDVLNFRWAKNLSVIAESRLESRDRRRKARSLLDAARSSAKRYGRGAGSTRARPDTPPVSVQQQTIVNGDIIQTGGVKINEVASDVFVAGGSGSGGVTVERAGTKKRRGEDDDDGQRGEGVTAGKRRMRRTRDELSEEVEEAQEVAVEGFAQRNNGADEVETEAEAEAEAEAVASPQTPSSTPPSGTPEVPPHHPADHHHHHHHAADHGRHSSIPSSSLPSSPTSPHPPYMDDPYSSFPPFPYDPLFVTTYLSIPPSQKHTFTTARVLEDIVYHHVRTTPAATPWLQNNPILQWIVDLSDPVVFRWFNTAEREEIAAWGPGLPDRDAAFEYAVGRFPTNPKSKAELYDVMETPSRPSGEAFDERLHATALYANSAASSILALLTSYASCPWLGPSDLREGWFASLWTPLLDRCLHTIPGLSVSRTDIKSAAGSANHRYDGVLRCVLADGHVYDLGAIEVSRGVVGRGVVGAKEADDGAKLVRGLRGMLRAVVEGTGMPGDGVQVVGVLCVGWSLKVWTMHMLGEGGVTVLVRGRPRSVPMTWEQWGAVVEVMRGVVRVKGIVERGIEAARVWEEGRRGRDVL